MLTLDERVELVMLCGRDGWSMRQVAQEFNKRHPESRVSRSTVSRLLNKFKTIGSVNDAPRSGRPPMLKRKWLIAKILNIQSEEVGSKIFSWTQCALNNGATYLKSWKIPSIQASIFAATNRFFQWTDKSILIIVQENPHWMEPDEFQGGSNVMVWCGIWRSFIIGPFFFHLTVTGPI